MNKIADIVKADYEEMYNAYEDFVTKDEISLLIVSAPTGMGKTATLDEILENHRRDLSGWDDNAVQHLYYPANEFEFLAGLVGNDGEFTDRNGDLRPRLLILDNLDHDEDFARLEGVFRMISRPLGSPDRCIIEPYSGRRTPLKGKVAVLTMRPAEALKELSYIWEEIFGRATVVNVRGRSIEEQFEFVKLIYDKIPIPLAGKKRYSFCDVMTAKESVLKIMEENIRKFNPQWHVMTRKFVDLVQTLLLRGQIRSHDLT